MAIFALAAWWAGAAAPATLHAAGQSEPIRSAEAEFIRVESAGRMALVAGRYADALLIARDALAFAQREFGPDHPLTFRALHDVAVVQHVQGEHVAALPLALQAAGGLERVAGADDPETLNAIANLAQLYLALDRSAAAEPLLRRVLAARERTLGAGHAATLEALLELAAFLKKQQRLGEIARELERGAAQARAELGPDSETARDLAQAAADARGGRSSDG